MPLDELHARRLATVFSMVEDGLDRIEMELRWKGSRGDTSSSSRLTGEQARRIVDQMESLRGRLRQAMSRFTVRRHKPEPRQLLAAELSTLRVILENAMPRRMKGYGGELETADGAEWENLIQGLLDGLDRIGSIAFTKKISD